MKRTIKTVAAFMIASSVLFTSCVKNEVSEQVTALRAAQLEMVNAKTDYQVAQAELMAAQANAQVIANTQQVAMNAEALRQQIAYVDGYVATQVAIVKEAELRLQTAILNLADYIAEHNIENAALYLSNYKSSMNTINNYKIDRIYAEADLAIAELNLQSTIENNSGNQIVLERQLAKAQADLAAMQASYDAYADFANNPNDLQGQLDALKVEITNYESDQYAVQAEQATANATMQAAGMLLGNANDLIDQVDGWNADIEDRNNDIVSYEESIVSFNEAIVMYNEEIAKLNADIAIWTPQLADTEADIVVFEAALAAAQADVDAAQADVDDATYAYDLANNAYNDDPSAANQTKLDNAGNALNDAYTALNDAYAARNLPQANFDTASNFAQNLQNNIDNAMNGISNYEDAIVNMENNIADYEGYIADANFDNDRDANQIAAVQGDYDDAKANLAMYADAYNDASRAYNDLNMAYSALNVLINELWGVYNNVEDDMWNIKNIMDGKMDDIAAQQDYIASINGNIITNSNGEYNSQADVDYYTEYIAELDAKIADEQAIADKWKALLDAALAGN